MKAGRLFCLCSLFLLVVANSLPASPVTLQLMGGLSNFAWNPDHTTPLDGAKFAPYQEIVWDGRVQGQFFSFLDFDLGYVKDPILQHVANLDFTLNLGYFRAGLGGMYGFVPNDFTTTSGGISILAGFSIPNWFFVDAKVFTSVGNDNSISGYGRSGLSGSGGFWLNNVRITGFYNAKTYTDRSRTELFIETELVEYGGKFTFYTKALPVQVDIFGGMRTMTRKYSPILPDVGGIDTANEKTDTIESAFAGLGIGVDFAWWLRWDLEGWADIGMASPSTGVLSFWAMTGFTFTLSN